MKFVNLPLMAHPLNWLTIAVWLFAIGYIFKLVGLAEPKQTNQPSG